MDAPTVDPEFYRELLEAGAALLCIVGIVGGFIFGFSEGRGIPGRILSGLGYALFGPLMVGIIGCPFFVCPFAVLGNKFAEIYVEGWTLWNRLGIVFSILFAYGPAVILGIWLGRNFFGKD